MAGVATGCLILARQYREEHEQIKSELAETMAAEDPDEKVMDESEDMEIAMRLPARTRILQSLHLETYAVRPRRNINNFINLQGVVDRWLANSIY